MEWFDAIPMSKVVERLYLGNFANASHLVDDNPKGITTIMDVSDKTGTKHYSRDTGLWAVGGNQINDDCAYTLPEGVKYRHNSFADGSAIPEDIFWDCMNYLKEQYEAGETILIHCIAGISRSPTITASFMHLHFQQWEFDSALLWLNRVRSIVSPAVSVKVSAKKYLKVFPYDGSYDQPEEKPVIWMDARGAAEYHPDENCPLRKYLLIVHKLGEDHIPQHTIPCTCVR